MNVKQTIQDSISENRERVDAWNEAHTESTYTKYKPYLRWLWVFIYTSLGIWAKALVTGKMSWKNIGLVLITSIPIMVLGAFVMPIWAAPGVLIWYLGHTILFGAILLVFPVNAIKVMFWMMKTSFEDSNGTRVQRYDVYSGPDDYWGPQNNR